MKAIILFGASSAIAQAYIRHVQSQQPQYHIVCVTTDTNKILNIDAKGLTLVQSDYSAPSLKELTATLQRQAIDLHQVVIFNGVLHSNQHMPEKKLEDINSEYFSQLLHTNTLVPLLCLQTVIPLLSHKTHCTITALSARVGSISDNQLGGWYSYRASKAALNMLFKTAAIELARRAKNCKLILFHPGTTDTELSKPFQKNVPANKLFTPEFVAQQLFDLTNNNPNLELNGEPAYIDWQGHTISW